MLTTHQMMTWAAAGLVVATASLAPLGAANRALPGSASDKRTLAGTWKAQEYKVAANSDLDVDVWGRGASRVRNVELMLEPDGDGILRVRHSVVDRKGVARPYSTSVVEARLKVELPDTVEPGAAVMPRVTVLEAAERYVDDPKDRRTLDGLTVSIHMPSPDSGFLNVRFDTQQGTGSFGETLNRRPAGAAPARATGAAPRS